MNKAWHIVSAVLLATLGLAKPALAHTGHGLFGDGVAHFLVSPTHALPVIAVAVLVGLSLVASRRTALVRSGGIVLGLGALLLLAVLI